MVKDYCNVSKFEYPTRIKVLSEPGPPITTTNRSRTRFFHETTWRIGFAFEAEAEFEQGGDDECGCCRFRQYVGRYQYVALTGGKVVPQDRGEIRALSEDRNRRQGAYGDRTNSNSVTGVYDGYGRRPTDKERQAHEQAANAAFASGGYVQNSPYIARRIVNLDNENRIGTQTKNPLLTRGTACYYWMFDEPSIVCVRNTVVLSMWAFNGFITHNCDGIRGVTHRDQFWIAALVVWARKLRNKQPYPNIVWSTRHLGKVKLQGVRSANNLLTPAKNGVFLEKKNFYKYVSRMAKSTSLLDRKTRDGSEVVKQAKAWSRGVVKAMRK